MPNDGSSDDELRERIVAARLKLRQRFLDSMRQTPALSDARPMGSGPPNRHGMPKVPVGQTPTAPGKWPVLDLGGEPAISLTDWRLEVSGECDHPYSVDWKGFLALEQVEDVSDFHCVTGWSKLDVAWKGVHLSTAIALAEPKEDAQYVAFVAYDGYTTNIPMAEALKDDVLLVHTAEGAPLPREHGGPVRVITPQLYAWKGAKWIQRIELSRVDRPGFWERNGYSNTAHPWRNDRYS